MNHLCPLKIISVPTIYKIFHLQGDGQSRNLFVFVGPQPKEVVDVLNKIENKQDMTDDEIYILTEHFSENYGSILGLQYYRLSNVQVYFIQTFIDSNDNIYEIKHKLFHHIKKRIDIFIPPQNQHLWMKNDKITVEQRKHIIHILLKDSKTITKEKLESFLVIMNPDYNNGDIDIKKKTITC